MIRINTAGSNELCYSSTRYNRAFGPFTASGESVFDSIEIRSSFDDLRERPGISGDNHVNHRELNANVYIDPWNNNKIPLTQHIRAGIKNPNGTWIKSTSLMWGSDHKPAFSWVRTPSTSETGYSFTRKTRPSRVETFGVTWKWTITGYAIAATSYTVEEVVKIDVKANLLHWKTNVYNNAQPDSKERYSNVNESISLSLSGRIISLAKAGNWTTKNKMDALYFPRRVRDFTPNGSDVTARDVLLKLEQVTEVPYEIPDGTHHGDLATEAVSTLDRNSINMFEFLQGLKRPQDLVPKLKNLSKLKTHAGNYLGAMYGSMPLVSDLETLHAAITASGSPYYDRNNFQVLTAGANVEVSTHRGHILRTDRVKIAINTADPALSTLSEKLRDIGGFPSINNLWDLVPYSFVIDWFINVGDMLESLDSRFRMSTLPIEYSTTSSKIIITPNAIPALEELGISGDISIVLYDRSVSSDPPVPPLDFKVSNELPNHWLEAGALIVVARK